MSKYLYIPFILQSILIGYYLLFVCKADEAMDKTGIGDLQAFNEYNQYAGIAFYTAVGIWLSVVTIALIKRKNDSKQTVLFVALPPILLVTGWFLLLGFT